MSLPLPLETAFRPFLGDLARFDSTRELEDSQLYRKLRAEIERVLSHVWCEDLAPPRPPAGSAIRAVAWNIERGIRLDEVIGLLRGHRALANADVLLLSELDWGMARTGNRFVAQEIGSALRLNYA